MTIKKFNLLILSVFGIMAIFGLVFLWVFFVGIKSGESGHTFNKGHNAVWIGHEWADEVKSYSEVSKLVSSLSSHGIDTLYVHVGPLDKDGWISPDVYNQVLNFTNAVKMLDENMRVFAWIGQLRDKLDLSNEATRHNISNLCMIFTRMIDMDGVHLDIEPVWDEDKDFIKLLWEIRTAIDIGVSVDGSLANGKKKSLSVALAEFMPSSFVWWTKNIADFKNHNTEKNYKNVAKVADQIVAMVYDTGIDRAFIYKWLVKEQIIWIGDVIDEVNGETNDVDGNARDGGDGEHNSSGRNVEFYVGIPAYDEGEAINPAVENVENALLGILSGLNDIRAHEENFTGVAIYPEWEISNEEWKVFDTLWNN